jgi:steroid delta-isomerase-like uncharacterized protein
MAQVSELLDQFVELFNAGRPEEGEQHYAPNGMDEEVGTGRRFTPHESVENARAWKQAFPDAHGTITTKIVDGNTGAAEIVWRGTNRGSLMGHPPTNKAVTVRAVLVLETQGGKITRSSHYIDVAGMMAQLGMGAAATA